MKTVVFSLLAVFIALAAADYHHHGKHHATILPGPAEILTYPGKVPLPPCGTVYLLTCNKNQQKVPCLVPAPAPAPYHPAPAPAYHKPEPAPAYHVPPPPPPPPPAKY